MKFKIGDRVRILSTHPSYKNIKQKIGTIDAIGRLDSYQQMSVTNNAKYCISLKGIGYWATEFQLTPANSEAIKKRLGIV